MLSAMFPSIDIYSTKLFFYNLISIVVIVLHYLKLITLQLDNKFFICYSNVLAQVELVITQFSDQVRMKLTLQLTTFWEFSKNYSSILMVQLFQHPFLPLSRFFSVPFALDLNDSESVTAVFSALPSSSLKYYHKFTDVFE